MYGIGEPDGSFSAYKDNNIPRQQSERTGQSMSQPTVRFRKPLQKYTLSFRPERQLTSTRPKIQRKDASKPRQHPTLNSQFSILKSQFSTTSFLVATPWGRYRAAT